MLQKADDINTGTRRCIFVGRVACNALKRFVEARRIRWKVVFEGMYGTKCHGIIV